MDKLRRRLRRALFFVGSCQYSTSYRNNSDGNHCYETKLFNQAEKILEAEPILYASGHVPELRTKPSLLALRIDQLGNRNKQLLANILEASRRRCKSSSFDTIDGQIAYLMDQVKRLYH